MLQIGSSRLWERNLVADLPQQRQHLAVVSIGSLRRLIQNLRLPQVCNRTSDGKAFVVAVLVSVGNLRCWTR